MEWLKVLKEAFTLGRLWVQKRGLQNKGDSNANKLVTEILQAIHRRDPYLLNKRLSKLLDESAETRVDPYN